MRIHFPEIHTPVQGLDTVTIPEMVTIHQSYDPRKIEDVMGYLKQEMNDKIADKDSFKGKRICITVGSRGIPDLDKMVRTMCDTLKEWGAEPFIIPAMGSHAGGNAEGQKEMIAGFNITEEWYDLSRRGIENVTGKKGAKSLGGHAVLVVGYNPAGVWVENSWSTDWGQDGFGFIEWPAFRQQFLYGTCLTNCLDGFK